MSEQTVSVSTTITMRRAQTDIPFLVDISKAFLTFATDRYLYASSKSNRLKSVVALRVMKRFSAPFQADL